MPEPNSTPSVKTGKPDKPSKPYPEFPLTAHPTGYWCKKIRGKIHYFGPWADPDGALAKYLEQKDALHAGRKPRADAGGLTVKELCNHFLSAKQDRVDSGELSPHTWTDYKAACDLLVGNFGKRRFVADLGPDDFAALRNRLAKAYGPHRLANTVQNVRGVFKHAFDNQLIDRPVCFGAGFARPSKKTMRLHRAAQGPRLFTPEEIRALLGAANPALKAMILLGMNAGYGNADCAKLPLAALDLERGWADYPRPKTGVPRRCPLWPETVAAIKECLGRRPEPKKAEHAGLVFIAPRGGPWTKERTCCPIARDMGELLHGLNINGRAGLSFYALRHTFRTVADEAKDQPAADFIMGHESPHMSSVYRERISDARLNAVTDYVRKWLFAEPPSESSSSAGGEPSQQEKAAVVPGFAGQSQG